MEIAASYTTSTMFVAVVVCYLVYFLYRKFFCTEHGGKLPDGPLLSLPLVGYLPFLGKEPHKALWRMRKKYGDVIGLYLGKNYTVVLNEFNVMKEVLSHPAALDRAPHLFDHLPRRGFISENGDKWIKQRRFCLSATRHLGLGREHWDDVIVEGTSSFIENVKSSQGKPVDVSDSIAASVASNILSLLIGRRLREEEEDKIQLAVDFADVSLSYTAASDPTSLIPGLRKLLQFFKIGGYDRARRIIHQFSEFIREEISLHKTSPEMREVQDFINTYLEKLSELKSENGKHYFSEYMLEGNVIGLFMGGSDTIISSMGWLLRLMAAHRDVQSKVHRELVEVVGHGGHVRYDERHKIPYTFAVIMESQRYSSIGTLSPTRKASQDIRIKDMVIPKGSDIVANLWALHNDPKYWKLPEEFRPERFLEEDGSLIQQIPSYAPFSIGKRNCPGETIAWIEILIYLSEIVKNFEISTPPGVEAEFKVISGLVAHLEPQPLCFKERISREG